MHGLIIFVILFFFFLLRYFDHVGESKCSSADMHLSISLLLFEKYSDLKELV